MAGGTARTNQNKDNKLNKDDNKSEAIVDEAISDYDELIREINRRDVENKQKHFRDIEKDLEKKAKDLVEKLNAL